MLQEARNIRDQLVCWRRTIHRQPELGFAVHKTADLVARTLNDLGIEIRTGVGKTGVVGYLGDTRGPVIAIRADMDALPIHEENQVEYASQIPGYMHACGHDAHTAMLLGVAALLSSQRLPGQVRLLFQPSEEIGDAEGISGAPRMIEDGAMDGVDAVIALHVDGTLDAGRIRIEPGDVGASVDTFRAYILGRGGHGAYPHQTVDPVWLTNQVLNALYAIPSRRIAPLEPSVISVGIVRGGTIANVLPETVYLEGTLRSFSEAVRQQVIAEVDRALALTRTYGGNYQLTIEAGCPATRNDPTVTKWLQQVGHDLLGNAHVVDGQRSMGAEDFSFMTQRAPGAMFSLGTRQSGQPSRFLHTPTFDIDEDALPVGSAILAETALRFLRGQITL